MTARSIKLVGGPLDGMVRTFVGNELEYEREQKVIGVYRPAPNGGYGDRWLWWPTEAAKAVAS